MASLRHRFESEVHLGLLVIILALVVTNLASNLILHNSRQQIEQREAAELRVVARGIARVMQEEHYLAITDSLRGRWFREFRLDHAGMMPSVFADTLAARATVPEPLREQADGLIDKIRSAERGELRPGGGDFYFAVYPITLAGNDRQLILWRRLPVLSYLDDSDSVIIGVALAALVVVSIVYWLLSQFIFVPIRKMRDRARQAGRVVDESGNEAEALAEEYRRIIEELRQREGELRRLNELISHRADSFERFNEYLLMSMDSGILTIDDDLIVRSVNAAAEEILGTPREGMLGKHVHGLLGRFAGLKEAIESAVSSGKSLPYSEYAEGDQQSSDRVLGVTLSLVRDPRQVRVGMSLLLTDLTEVSDLRRRLEHKNRLEALGEMAAGLAHQLRNSLAAVAGFGTLVKRKAGGEPATMQQVESLLQETKTAERLIDQFLSFARPLEVYRQQVSLRELVDDIVTSLAARQAQPAVTVDNDVPSGLEVDIDPLLMRQALANIIDNGIRACRGSGDTVSITATREGDRVRIAIADSGEGIADDQRRRIFTPFFSSRPDGTGLGLPLAGKIVGLHGGEITVDSEVGRGSTFTLLLPATAGQISQTTSTASPR